MRIKNFKRFVNENLDPHSHDVTQVTPEARYGEPIFFDDDELKELDWQPTGDPGTEIPVNPKTDDPNYPAKPDSDDDFEYDDYYPEEEEIDDDFDFEEDFDTKGTDREPFISDVDVESDTSERDDYFY